MTRCITCGTEKDRAEFYSRNNECKVCWHARSRRWAMTHPEATARRNEQVRAASRRVRQRARYNKAQP